MRTFLVVPSRTWRRIDGCGLLRTISRGVRSILGMKSPECLERESEHPSSQSPDLTVVAHGEQWWLIRSDTRL
jgi:hypothetical protein